MIRLTDTLGGDKIYFDIAENKRDLYEVRDFIKAHHALGLDTEASWANCYRPGWKLRTWQCGNATQAYVVPAHYRKFIWWAMGNGMGRLGESDTQWIAHNGPHDIRSIDYWLGRRTRVICADTYIPSHHLDSRNRDEGGVGHALKELSIAHIDRQAGKWEKALKEEFKKILIPIEGEVYKSGPRKGTQKFRKAKLVEGWDLIPLWNLIYLAYAAADPILTYRLWGILQPVIREFYDLYKFDLEVQEGYSELQRRAMKLDVDYTERLSQAYEKRSHRLRTRAWELGCENIQSGDQIAATLINLGVKLRSKTDSGKWKTDAELLRKLAKDSRTPVLAKNFIRVVLGAKQVEKRRASYTEAMLRERDSNDRVHPGIKPLAARTTRSSVVSPAFQQLPTKDREDEVDDYD
jgi:DNA polymerase-1